MVTLLNPSSAEESTSIKDNLFNDNSSYVRFLEQVKNQVHDDQD